MIMQSRYQAILKLAKETLLNKDLFELNSMLRSVSGWDFIDIILKEKGLSRGSRLDKNHYLLIRDGSVIGNYYLEGGYQRIQVVPRIIENNKQYKIPRDAYYSPAALYDLFENDQD